MQESSKGDHHHEERLSRIATQWSIVLEAHDQQTEDAETLRASIVQRYSAAAYRYLLGAVRDTETAEDLCHEFAVQCLQGGFHRADPQRGRFRDYVKKSLINLVNQYHRTQQKWPRSFPSENFDPGAPAQTPESEREFEDYLRQEMLDATWNALQQQQPSYYTILKTRIDDPSWSSRELADDLSRRLNKRLTAETFRTTLKRARSRFAELLLDEVARSSGSDTAEQLQTELQHLGLLKYCRDALERRAKS